jgi:signal transduction histidine kinase/ActR/RegA family two-component response regulator
MARAHSLRSPRLSAALGLVAIVLVGLGCYGYYVSERRTLVRSATGTLEVIADLKVQQVRDWIGAVRAGADAITDHPFLPARIVMLVKSPTDLARARAASGLLAALSRGHRIDYMYLLNANGRIQASSPPDAPAEDPERDETVARARSTGQPAWTDIHRDGDRIFLECVIPVPGPGRGGSATAAGYLWLRADPTRSLFPLIQAWPTLSRTAETLLVRQDGTTVTYLNELRHRRGAALTLGLPMVREALPAARALQGYEGVLEGRDYRGVPVLAVTRRVPGTAWALVTKVDLAEIQAPVRQRATTTIVVALALCLAVALAVGAAWQRREAQFYRRQYEAEAEHVSERTQLEAQLHQAQKMEAVGQLAGGIAHDFNNLLTVITGRSELALDGLPEDNLLRHDIALIQSTAERAAALTRQLLVFSRRQVTELKVLDLNAVVSGLAPMVRRVIGEDIDFATVADPNLGRVKADPAQVEQIIMNLAVNARDAMPAGGRLTIETANVELDAAYARTHVEVTPGRYVLLSVSDTGHGMTAEVQARMFEPFFTTKEQGKGTGLGLATVHGIVKQSGGHIWVYSEPGNGTTFKVYFPRVDDVAEPVTAGAKSPAIARGSETILLVEDEEQVRALARQTLEASGYQVIAAATPAEALARASDGARPIDLLLTDVVMPEMSGAELAQKLTREHEQLRVLYMSGYTGNAILRHGILDHGAAFLQKPFTTRTLRESVRRALQQT